MKEIEISDDIVILLEEINDGEAVVITEEDDGEITSQIILIRPIALALVRNILELLGEDEEEEKPVKTD